MTEYNSVFRDEIITHLSSMKAELSHDAYRHYERTMSLFDKYLCEVNHVEKKSLNQ